MGHYRTHKCNELRAANIGDSVVLSGWLANQRDQGGILFIALRDHYGITQLTLQNDNPAYEVLSALRVESTIRIEGEVIARPNGQSNPNMETGEIEVLVKKAEVLATSDIIPFPIVEDPRPMKPFGWRTRYLDLRRPNL